MELRIYSALFGNKVLLLILIAVFIGITGCQKSYFARELTNDDVPLEQMKLPVIKTKTVSTVTQNSAQSGGEIVSDGGGLIRASGICWSTSASPTVDQDKTTNGPTHGSFDSFVTKLNINTKYYLRAYATNAKGTGYGEEFTFTTTSPLAELTTIAISNISSTGFESGGIITAFGETVTERGICWSSERLPTVADSKTTNGAGGGTFSATVSGLTAGVTYRMRAYAVNSGGVAYGNTLVVTPQLPTVTDIDGNVYHLVVIGTQTWMVENFKAKRFRNGDAIPNLLSLNSAYTSVYGQFYDGNAVVDNRKLAPAGWRVPTLADWQMLSAYLGGNSGKAKEAGTAHWLAPNLGATNESGFTALGAGHAIGQAEAVEVGVVTMWWTQTAVSGDNLWRMAMTNTETTIYNYEALKFFQLSVRLIKE